MNIAIVSKNKNKYSETFIHNQVKHLPFQSHLLYGDYLPPFYGNDQSFITNDFISQLSVLINSKLLNRPHEEQLKTKIAGYIKQNDIKVVLANYALSAIPFIEICEQAEVPLVVHFHGYTAYRNDIFGLYKEGYRQLFSKASAIVSVSDHMTGRLVNIGAPESKITKIVYGVDPQLFNPSTTKPTGKTILYNGRFCDTKNPHLVILAFHKLLNTIPDATLVMVGDGELMPACVSLVKALNIGDKVILKGVLNPQEVAEQMREAAMLVQFSGTTPNNDTEGTPLTVLEAGLTGLPVIAARSGGLPEVVLENETGYLVDEFDIEALVVKMQAVLTNPQKSEEMAQRLRQQVLGNYTIEKYITHLAALLNDVAKKKK